MNKSNTSLNGLIKNRIPLLVTNKCYTRIRKSLKEYIKYIGSILFGLYYHPISYITTSDSRLIYINNDKSASSAIKAALWSREPGGMGAPDDQSIHTNIQPLNSTRVRNRNNQSIVFSFVRNPFEKLVSLYLNKFRSLKNIEYEGFYFNNYLNDIFTINMSFDEFVEIVCSIPDAAADRHFRSQYATIHHDPKLEIDFIGKLENFIQDWEKLNKMAGQSMAISHYNRSDKYDYREFYTKELAELVAKRYEKDITSFGYDGEYASLLQYLR